MDVPSQPQSDSPVRSHLQLLSFLHIIRGAAPTRRRVLKTVLAAAALVLAQGCYTFGPESFPAAVESPYAGHVPGDWMATPPALWPLAEGAGELSSSFGARRGGRLRARYHSGLDIRAPRGTPVIAPGNATVLAADRDRAYGLIVKLEHGAGVETWFAHLDNVEVSPGEQVFAGDVIGSVGRTGNATGYHLHYEVRVDGAAIDPADYLRDDPVYLAQAQ